MSEPHKVSPVGKFGTRMMLNQRAFFTNWEKASEDYADASIAALKEIDRMNGEAKPDDHPDYDRERILASIRHAMARSSL